VGLASKAEGTFPVRGGFVNASPYRWRATPSLREKTMHQLIYLVGLVVVILAILSFFGLR
jgi:hypothetical protein